MKNISKSGFCQFFVPFIFCYCLVGSSVAKNFEDSKFGHIDYPDWFNESPFLDLAEDLARSRSNKKSGLMVLFTTEGCSYCSVFIQKSLGDPEIAAVVQKNFDSIGLEIFDDTEMTTPQGVSMPVKKFAMKEGVQFSPTLLFYGEGGKRILRLTGYLSPERFKKVIDFVINNHYRSESLRDYLKRLSKNASTTLSKSSIKADSLFSEPPRTLDRSRIHADRPLLIIFEKQGCAECEDFHSDVLAQKEVREVLTKFEIVRLDAADIKNPIRSPDGNLTTPALWYEQAALTRVPALLFFDERGNEVLKTDTLVLHQRMMNSLNYVLERAYKKGWTYQRFARSKAIERSQKSKKGPNPFN